jgi:hypothetical protein
MLVKWSGQEKSLATWEDLNEAMHRFPDALAWEQPVPEGEGDVKSRVLETAVTGCNLIPAEEARPK